MKEESFFRKENSTQDGFDFPVTVCLTGSLSVKADSPEQVNASYNSILFTAPPSDLLIFASNLFLRLEGDFLEETYMIAPARQSE
jgi:hypothetical protein